MAVIIREDKILDGKKFEALKVYKSDKFPITKVDEEKADQLDSYLAVFFKELNSELMKNELIKLKGKIGVLELWYYVGTKLSFIDDTNILEPADKKFIWKSIWYHAGEIAPGEPKFRSGTSRDHFLFCYKLAKYPKEFVFNAGNWRNWQDFFDSPILSNNIVLNWFENNYKKIAEYKIKNWLREFLPLIRNEFQNVDMNFLRPQEIVKKLDTILESFINSAKNIK